MTAQLPLVWRDYRGAALLAALGSKEVFPSPRNATPPWEGYVRRPYLITFRGGQWKSWWDEELTAYAALAKSVGMNGVIVVNEVAGDINLSYISCPSNYQEILDKATEAYLRNERINKSSQMGRAWCPHCPVRRECDQIDVQNGQIADWPTP